MPARAKAKRATPRRRTVAVPTKTKPIAKSALYRPMRVSVASKPKLVVIDPKPQPVNPVVSIMAKAQKFLSTLADYEKLRIVRYNADNFDLDRMRSLLKKLGNPQDTFRSVHVAGTKGKGSTCTMIANMLQACGYKVGVYTSPHLVDIRERIVINGEMIPATEFARIAKLIEPLAMRPSSPALPS